MKLIYLTLSLSIMLTGCSTSQQVEGTLIGANMGAVIGSSIGGYTRGYRGRDLGTVIGLIAGAAVGNAVTAPRSQTPTYTPGYEDEYAMRYQDDTYRGNYQVASSNNPTQAEQEVSMAQLESLKGLTVTNLRFIDDNRNQTINGGESAKIIFELMNRGQETLYDVVPYLSEVSGNPRIIISPSTKIESIEPGNGIRYTATIKADKKLETGKAVFSIAVSHSDSPFTTVREFELPTSRK